MYSMNWICLKYLNVRTLLYRTSNLSNVELDLISVKNNGSSNESLLSMDNSKTQLLSPTNYDSHLRPLVDITVKLEDIVPSMLKP